MLTNWHLFIGHSVVVIAVVVVVVVILSAQHDSDNADNHRHYQSNERVGWETGRVAAVRITCEDASTVDTIVIRVCYILTRVEHVAGTTEPSRTYNTCKYATHSIYSMVCCNRKQGEVLLYSSPSIGPAANPGVQEVNPQMTF